MELTPFGSLSTILAHDMCAAREEVELDPQTGFSHGDRPGTSSPALKLLVDMRSVVAVLLAVT